MSDLHSSLPKMFKEVAEHCRQLDSLAEKVFDLWTWLPYRRKMQRFHGDYVDEVQPSTEIVVEDANRLISFLMGYDSPNVEHDMYFNETHMDCYCGEVHEAGTDDHHDYGVHEKFDNDRFRAKVIAIHEFAQQWDEEHKSS